MAGDMIDPRAVAERALAASTADGCVVIVSEHTEANLRWAANNLTTNGRMASRTVTVISTMDVADGTSAGVVDRAVTTAAEVDALVADSERAARAATPADDAAPLIEPYPVPDDWHADIPTTSAEVFADLVAALGRARRAAAGREQLLFGFAEHQMTSTFLATSTGLRRRFDQPDGRLELNAKSADYADSAFASAHTVDFTDVDVEQLVDDLARRLAWSRRHVDLPAGRYETILPPTAVADLFMDTYWGASARDAEEGRSVYSAKGGATRLGAQLCELPISMYSDPAYPGLECAPFEIAASSAGGLQSVFDNGAPIEPTQWISGGRLNDLVRTRAWAARDGSVARPFTGNLIIDGGGTASVEDMIASSERALLLTCLWYIREVDPQTMLLTGLTRDGVYLIEDGSVVGAVNNYRFNESPVSMLGRITEIGATRPTLGREWSDYFSRTAMPAMRVADFNMSTVSQAS